MEGGLKSYFYLVHGVLILESFVSAKEEGSGYELRVVEWVDRCILILEVEE